MRDAFIFPGETDEKKNPNSRITRDRKQQCSKEAFLLYTNSSVDK